MTEAPEKADSGTRTTEAPSLKPPEVLLQLNQLDYCLWRYAGEDESWHLGPMAQDFREAFELGRFDPTLADGWDYILPVDHLGVHGVAIQQLTRMLTSACQRIAALEEQVSDLEGQVRST